MDRDLRVVGARLDAQVAARTRGIEVVTAEPREVLQARGPTRLEPEPAEERGPVPDGDRQSGRREVERLAGQALRTGHEGLAGLPPC